MKSELCYHGGSRDGTFNQKKTYRGMKIEWKTGRRKVSDLRHWEKNPRVITQEKLEELKEKIMERGFHDVLKLDEDGMILSGNMRKEALEQLGIEEVNVLIPDRALTEEEKILVGIESNIQAGEWDWKSLASFDKELLINVGFSEEECRVNFGITDAELQDVEIERMKLLAVYPPEAARLAERVAVHFDDPDDYAKVKAAILSGKITAETLLKAV